MKSKRKTPDIRFRGFTDDWEQRKLGELTGKISDGDWIESNHIVEDGDFRIIQTGNIGLGEFLNKENNSKFINFNSFNELKANEIFKDDILISRLADPAGRTIILPELKGRFVTAVDVAIVKPSEDFDSYFLMTSLNTVLSLNEVSKFVSGTSHKRISRKNLEKVTINVTNIYEQVLIGNLFSNIDNTITLHQRKLQQLKEVKRGMLLKMFPIGNKKTPSLRFYGFKEKWVNKRIRDLILKGGSGGTPRSTNPEFYNGDIPFLSIKDITSSNGYIVDTEKKITKEGLENSSAWIVPSGSICLAMYASVGKLAIANIDLATSQAFYNMVFESDIIRNFSYQRLILANESGEWERLVSTGTQANLNAEKVRNFEFKISKEEEELKEIGLFFKKLDRMIELQEREIELLEETKKGFLQKMFV